jgi:CBS domain-containing protein
MANNKRPTVRDIMMGSPVTLSPDDTLDLANDVISIGRIRHIPVLDQGRLVGIISQRDLLSATADRIFGLTQKSRSELLKKELVKNVMKRRVITVSAETPIKEAARLMMEKKIGCVPVMNKDDLVGLVTTTNVLRYLESII